MKLFIGNLSFDTTEPELREVFEPFAPILEFHRPHDRDTGRARGFAFITLIDHEKGNAAIEALDGSELGGRKLKVNEAEDRGFQRSPSQNRNTPQTSVGKVERVDDRPTDKSGKKIVYKGI